MNLIVRASIGSDSLALTEDKDAQSYRDIIVFYNSPFSNRSASFKTSTTMRGIFTTLAVCSFAAASFAATLMPASGVYYPGDINNSGVIHVEFNDSVANPTATISVNGSSVSANMFEEGSTGRFWAVEVQEALQNVVTTNGKAISLTVNGGSETVTGSYTYMPVFPLTDITPENYTVLSSKDASVTFQFNQNVTYTGIEISSGTKSRTLAGGTKSTVSVSINANDWDAASGNQTGISVRLLGVTVGGTPISNVSGYNNAIGASYYFNETSTVQYLGYSPSNTAKTYQQVWDEDWYVSFNYSDEVQLPYVEDQQTMAASVRFYDEDDDLLYATDLVSYDEVFVGYNPIASCWAVQVAIPEVPARAEDYEYAVISVYGLSYNGATLPQQTAKYYATLNGKSVKKAATAGLANLIVDNTEAPIYNLNGVKVGESLQNLPAGIYVVNGKKIVIR